MRSLLTSTHQTSAANKALLLALYFLLTACASLPENKQQVFSQAFSDTQETALSDGITQHRQENQINQEQTGMVLLEKGLDAMVARLAMAQVAERSLDVQYYLYHSDLSGGLLTYELWQAAERGVRVRLLLDDMDMAGKDQNLAKLDAHKNIEIRLFNPFIRGANRTAQFVTRFGSVTRRSHNKAFIVDNQVAIIGGRNIGDEYFDASPNMAFGDLDIALTNPGAAQVSEQFDLYWNHELAYPISTLSDHPVNQNTLTEVERRVAAFREEHKNHPYLERLANSGIIERTRAGKTHYHWGEALVVYDNPNKISSDREKTEYHLTPQLEPYITNVKEQLLVISPYFVPGKEGVDFFADLEKRGVEVKILTNSLTSNDVPVVHAGYSRYRKKLLKAGVELFEMDKNAFGTAYARDKTRKTREGLKGSKSSLHAKYFVMDNSHAFIGSLNLDPRSVVENTEIGAVIVSDDLARYLADNFDSNIAHYAFEVTLESNKLKWQRTQLDGSHETYYKEPHSSWWDRFSVGFMRLLPGESQL